MTRERSAFHAASETTGSVTAGRSFFSTIDRWPESYTGPNRALLLERGIERATGLGASGYRSVREVRRG